MYIAAPGGNYYAVIQSTIGNQFLNNDIAGNTLETYNASHWSKYAIALSDVNSLGEYTGTFPVIAEARYRILIFQRAGGSPSTSDAPPVSLQMGYWDEVQLLHDASAGVFLAQSQGDIAFNSLQAGGVDVATTDNTDAILDALTGSSNVNIVSINGTSVSFSGSTLTVGGLPLIFSLADGAGLGGIRAITIQVNDTAGSAIQAAKVRISLNGQSESRTTNVAGNFTTSLDDLTYGIAITAGAGIFEFTPTTFTVTGDATFTFQMTPIVHPVPPTDLGQVVASGYARDGSGNLAEGVVIGYRLKVLPTGESGSAFQSDVLTATSGADGFFSFPAWIGSTIELRVNSGGWNFEQLIPATNFELDDFR
jgi:hypothetical protein